MIEAADSNKRFDKGGISLACRGKINGRIYGSMLINN